MKLRLFALFLILAPLGCQPQNPPQPSATQPASSISVSTTNPSDDSPAALARRSEEYAQQIQALLNRHPANPTATQPAATEPGIVATTTRPAPSPAITTPQPTTAPIVSSPAPEVPIVEIHPPTTATPIKPTRTVSEISPTDPTPRDLASHLDFQLARFAQDQPTPDLQLLSSLSSEDRELIATIMDGLANFRAVARSDPNALLSRKVRPLLEMADRLRSQSDLSIPTACICTAVKGYGAYDPLITPLLAGHGHKVLVYAEVTGFASRADAGQTWETSLSEEITLFRNDEIVWKKPHPDVIQDKCRNRRHDFYSVDMIQLPDTLPAGPYTMKITLIDQIANRVAETTLPVTIVSTYPTAFSR